MLQSGHGHGRNDQCGVRGLPAGLSIQGGLGHDRGMQPPTTPTSKDSEASPPSRGRWLRRLPLVVILGTAVAGALLLHDQLGFASLARHQADLLAFRDAHYLAAVLGFVLAYIAIVSFSLPGGTVATLTGGFLFGLFPGVVFNVLAAGTGAVLVFLAARAGFGAALAQRLERRGGAAARLQEELVRNEWSVLFLMRLVPMVPFFVANLVPALLGTSLWRYTVATYLGIVPGALVFTSVGAGLGEVFARGETPDLGVIFEPQILVPLLGLVGLAALPILLNARRRPG